MTDTDKLKRLAEAAMTASPAPWLYRSEKHDDWGVVRASDGWPLLQVSVNRHSQDELARHRGAKTDPVRAEAEYIAAANPQAILALIAENERLVDQYRLAMDRVEENGFAAEGLKQQRDEAVALLREFMNEGDTSSVYNDVRDFLARIDAKGSE